MIFPLKLILGDTLAASYLKTYFAIIILTLLTIGMVNLAIDPLWYGQGNRLTGINPSWNERIAKTNLFLQHSPQTFDCLIFGTSRTTLLRTDAFKKHHCFNYSFSSAKAEEFVTYGQFIRQKGATPKIIYVEIEPDELNYKRKPQELGAVDDPLPWYKTYFFSWDTFWLSLRTLQQDYPSVRLYDRNFQGIVTEDAPKYKPKFASEAGKPKQCDLSRLRFFSQLRQTFPEAQFVGFVAPVSIWYLFNKSYSLGLLNCQLSGIHQLNQIFDQVYDFAIPSALTMQTDNTYDGNHYYSSVFDRMADVLEGRNSDIGILTQQYSLRDYQQTYATELKTFLFRAGKKSFWRG